MLTTDKPTLRQKEWDRIEAVIERFEEAWQNGQRPAMEDYLKEGADVEPHKLLLELIHVELECRLKAGDAIRVESYFERYPAVATDREAALDLIAAEYKFRQRSEPIVRLGDYERRFPHYGEELRARLLPLRERESFPSYLSCPHCHKAIPVSESTGQKQLTCSACGGSFRFDLAHTPAWSPQALPRLDQFELLKEVGQGAFGTVYRARDAELGRIVAIKVPRGGRWLTPADQDRFVREARNVAQLAHPGIVPVYEVGHGESVPYLVSAYVEGVTLANVLTSRRFSFREAAEIIAQVAQALDHAHRRGVVHRDLKPSNIMLGRIEGAASAVSDTLVDKVSADPTVELPETVGSTQAYVMDFGLSRREEGEITVTMEGQILGTPAYMSPEQARGEGHHVDGRSDIYSLGVILYELLTGEIPFRGVTRMVLQQIQFEEPRPPRRLNDRIPRDLETITLKCMAKEPSRRYATAADVAAELRRHLKGEPILARPVGRLERCWRWAKRNPRVAALLGVVALLLATVVVGSVLAAVAISQERDATSEQLDLVKNTLSKLVEEVQDQLRDKPTMHQLRENLLRSAIPGLEQLAHSERAAKYASNSIGAANLRLGDIFWDLGKMAKALQYYAESHAQLEAYVAANPQSIAGRRNLAASYHRLGEMARRRGDFDTSREYNGKALELAQALADSAPGDARALRDLAVSHQGCGDVNFEVGDLAAALREYRAALEIARRAEAVDAEGTETRRALAESHDKVGQVLLRSGAFDEAAAHFEKALRLRENLASADPESRTAQRDLARAHGMAAEVNHHLLQLPVALKHAALGVELHQNLASADPQDARAQRDLAQAYVHLAQVHIALGDLAAVRDDHLKSLQLTRQLAAANRDDITAQTDLGLTYFNLGINAMDRRCYEEAAKWFEQGIPILRDLKARGKLTAQAPSQQTAFVSLSMAPQRSLAEMERRLIVCAKAKAAIDDLGFALAQPPELVADLLFIRAAVLASRGQHASAAAALEKLCTLDPRNASNLYDAACGYALCAASVGDGKAPEHGTPEEGAVRKRYAARAIELLAAVIQLGVRDVVKIETDPDLLPIRQEPGYRDLLARLKATLKKG